MATTVTSYGPYDAGAGANITEGFWRSMMGGINTSGVIAGYLNQLATTGDSTGMQVKVATGGAWINGAYGENTSGVQTISIGASHATLNRYDLIVLRNNYTTNLIEIDVIVGTNGASPTIPTVTQNTVMHEIALAYVYIAATVTTITAANVTDQRQYHTQNNYIKRKIVTTAAADTITIDNLPSKKYLRITFAALNTGIISRNIRFNGDTGNNYNWRYSTDGAADTATGTTSAIELTSATTSPSLSIVTVVNVLAQEKLVLGQTVAQNTAGVGNVADKWESAGKWCNTVAVINSVSMFNSAAGDFAAGTEFTLELWD